MNKYVSALLIALMLVSLMPVISVAATDVVLNENEYIGVGEGGVGGPITVKVTLENDQIKAIKVLEQNETRGLGTTAMLKLTDAMIKANSAEVDNVTGATITCDAFKAAVQQALSGTALGKAEEAVYEGTGEGGVGGPITVSVTLSGEKIVGIKVLQQNETRGLGTTAMLKLTDAMIKANSTEVDNITGATITCDAFKAAVQQALDKAQK